MKNKRPMGLGALLNNQLGWPWAKFPKVAHALFFLSQDVEIDHLFALRAAISEIMADFQNCHFWAWNLHAWPLAKIPEVEHILCFLQGLKKIELILILRAEVSEILADFQNCYISAWIPEVAHTGILFFFSKGLKLSLFLLYGQWFPTYGQIFKTDLFGHETWQAAKVPEVAQICSFYPRQPKLSLFLLYGQQFLRYMPIFKIAIFGHETWQVAKVPEVAHKVSFYPKGSKFNLFSFNRQWFLRYMGWFSKLPYLDMKLSHWPKFHILSFYPGRGSKSSLFLLYE